MLSQLRWIAIIATVLFVGSLVAAWNESMLLAIYWAIAAVFLLVADLVTRK